MMKSRPDEITRVWRLHALAKHRRANIHTCQFLQGFTRSCQELFLQGFTLCLQELHTFLPTYLQTYPPFSYLPIYLPISVPPYMR